MNPAAELLEQKDPQAPALVAIDGAGNRVQWTFAEVSAAAAGFAGWLQSGGVGRGDTVMTLIGNRPEWVAAMLGIWRIGAVALPCHASLRPKDIALRSAKASPSLVICDPATRGAVDEASIDCLILELPAAHMTPDAPHEAFAHEPAAAASLDATEPALVIFTSGTASEPVGIVHGVRWLEGQELQARHWFAAPAGSMAWCTSAPGWSKSSRNVFLAPWLCDATALIHDARFDPAERLEILEREGVAALCQAPTEYRLIAAAGAIPPLPELRSMVAAGEALDAAVIGKFEAATGVRIRDGYGQTETAHLTHVPPGCGDCPPGSMGRPLPGIELTVEDGELIVDPATVPTFFIRTLDGEVAAEERPWHTGDLVREENGWLFFEGRSDDVIASGGYRIGPFEVESALGSHPAVAESAAVAAPDVDRGSVVRAVVVLAAGFAPSDELAAELQEHVKAVTAPYKFPRIVEFAAELPKTATGKVRRAALRGDSR